MTCLLACMNAEMPDQVHAKKTRQTLDGQRVVLHASVYSPPSDASSMSSTYSGEPTFKDVKEQFAKKIAESPHYKPPTPKNIFLPSEGGTGRWFRG